MDVSPIMNDKPRLANHHRQTRLTTLQTSQLRVIILPSVIEEKEKKQRKKNTELDKKC